MSQFVQDLTKNIKGAVLPGESLKRHTTWRIGGPAEVLVMPENQDDVIKALKIAADRAKTVTVIGNGSNLLVADCGIEGIVLKLAGGMANCRIRNQHLIAESGCLLPGLARQTVESCFSGLEFAAGIPASLGGALVMNAGAHGGELGAIVEEVQACNFIGEKIGFSREDCGFGYRTSIFQQGGYIILGATLKLNRGNKESSLEMIKNNLEKRRQSQPLEYPNSGSVFRNVPGFPAGKLIDEAGAKGLRIGGAMVSEKHANFIINTGEATAADVLALIDRVKEMVFDKFQIQLHPEIRILGYSRE